MTKQQCELGQCPEGWDTEVVLICSNQFADTENVPQNVYCVLPDNNKMQSEWHEQEKIYISKPLENNDNNHTIKLCAEERVLCDSNSPDCYFRQTCSTGGVIKNLSWLDRLLPLWIILAMGIGLICGYFIPGIDKSFNVAQLAGTSLPICIGLWLMMLPVLTKVRYENIWEIIQKPSVWSQLTFSLVVNWIIGPALMTGLAWATLPDLPGYRNGVIMVGLARCIAMVLIWNQLAKGHPEFCAILVAANSVLQIVLYAPLALLYLNVVSGGNVHVNFWPIARSVLIFLGAPLLVGIVTRYSVIALWGRRWLDKTFLPWFGPVALLALLYTVWVLFTLQGHQVINNIGSVCRVAIPMICYFSVMWAGTLILCRYYGVEYDVAITQAFTASSNNFELAIAVAVGTFGITSQEALAATVGPLIEVPVLLSLVYVALWLRKKIAWK